MEQGLAGMDQEQQIEMAVAEVMLMLKNGISQDELIQQGVPEEIIQMAIQILNQEQAIQGNSVQSQPMRQPQVGMEKMGLA